MNTVQEIQSAIRQLSQEEISQIHDWLEDLLEDELEFTDEFKASIERGTRQIAAGQVRRVIPCSTR